MASSWLILASSWRPFGSSWHHLGSSWRHLGSSWHILAHLGTSWGPLETPWKGFGRSWGSLGKVTFGCAKTHRIIEIDALRDRYLRGVPFANTDLCRCDPQKFEHVRHFGRHLCVSLERQRFCFRQKRLFDSLPYCICLRGLVSFGDLW